jgi:UrcA family protein
MIKKALPRLGRPAALVAVALAFAPIMSTADPLGNDTVAVKVSTTDLDVSSPAGVEKLFVRLTSATTQACGVESHFDPLRTNKFDRCYRDTLNNAVRAANSPLLTQVYVDHYPREAALFKMIDSRRVATR